MSYDILLGYTGIVSFGHAMFFGMGAYTTAVMLKNIEPTMGVFYSVNCGRYADCGHRKFLYRIINFTLKKSFLCNADIGRFWIIFSVGGKMANRYAW